MTSEVIDALTSGLQDTDGKLCPTTHGELPMKILAASLLFVCACVGPSPAEAPKVQSSDPATIDAVKQVAQDMGDAMVAADVHRLDQIYADDFATVTMTGKVLTKKDLVDHFESFHDKLVSFENGPIDVQVFDNVAVSQGTVKEQRSQDGQDASGEFAWMDLLERRAGRWVVVRSAAARLAPAGSAGAPSQDPAAADAIRTFEQHVGDAMVAFDVDTLKETYADDWATVRTGGSVFTKEGLLDDFSSRKHQLVSFELGPMKVRVLGDVAMVQAGVTEKTIQDGKDVSGAFVFMDLLKKRAGKWVIFRTLGRRVI
jgi:uncharacterized protein (TIGR02246 family)